MKILMIAYYFPPDSSSGAFRPSVFARDLYARGEKIWVLTPHVKDFQDEQPQDEKLLNSLNREITILRTRVRRPKEALLKFWKRSVRKTPPQNPSIPLSATSAGNQTPPLVGKDNASTGSPIQRMKDFLTEILVTPDSQIGWLPSAVSAGRKIIREHEIDVIYATGGPWTSLLVAAILRKLTKKPVVLDFRDPWVANPYRKVASPMLRSLEVWMERTVMASADHIITNTAELKQNFIARYPALSPEKLTPLPNGFDEYVESQDVSDPHVLTITHAGALYFSRNPRCLVQAAFNLIERKVIAQNELRLVFLGGISIQDPDLDHLLQHPLLREVVACIPRVPYQEAMQYQRRSDVLLLLQPDFPLQIPRKLYEYMAFRKPLFAITNQSGATATLIQRHKLGIVVENETAALEHALTTIYAQWKHGQLQPLDTSRCDEFMNNNLTLTLQRIFQGCLPARA